MLHQDTIRRPERLGESALRTGLSPTTRVLIADRRPMSATGLAQLIARAPDLSVYARCHHSADVRLTLLADVPPDLTILDVGLYEHDAMSAVKTVRALGSQTAILLTTTRVDDSLLLALSHEDVACVSAYSDGRRILTSVRALIEGQPLMQPEVQAALATRLRGPTVAPLALTPREKQVFELAADGLTTHSIAQTLHISHSTVKTHLRHVYERLNAPNRAAAVATAARMGILKSPIALDAHFSEPLALPRQHHQQSRE